MCFLFLFLIVSAVVHLGRNDMLKLERYTYKAYVHCLYFSCSQVWKNLGLVPNWQSFEMEVHRGEILNVLVLITYSHWTYLYYVEKQWLEYSNGLNSHVKMLPSKRWKELVRQAMHLLWWGTRGIRKKQVTVLVPFEITLTNLKLWVVATIGGTSWSLFFFVSPIVLQQRHAINRSLFY